MLVRKIARAMLAAPFVVDGLDAARRPAGHVDRARASFEQLRSDASRAARLDLLPVPSDERLTALVRAHGAATTVAGLALAKGVAPRTAALVLAALTAPLVAADVPDAVARVPKGSSDAVVAERRESRRRLAVHVALLGAAILTAVDREGRPGVAWRFEHSLDQHRAGTSPS